MEKEGRIDVVVNNAGYSIAGIVEVIKPEVNKATSSIHSLGDDDDDDDGSSNSSSSSSSSSSNVGYWCGCGDSIE